MLNLRLMDYLHGVYLVEMELKPSSIRQMEISIRLFSKWLGRSATLADLEPDVVSRWLQDYRQAQSATTVMSKRRQVLTLWHHGYDTGRIEQDVRRVCRFKQPRIIPVAWTIDELRRLLDACYVLPGRYPTGILRATFWELFIRIAYDTGLRKGDVLSLAFDQLQDDGRLVLSLEKTGWSHVCGPLRLETLEVLQATLPPERELLCPFPSQKRHFYKWWGRIREAAGVPDGAAHKIRKTAASYLERDNPGAAMAFLGHRTPGMSYRYYVDPTIANSNTPLPPDILNQGDIR